jgi:hypothetical protein
LPVAVTWNVPWVKGLLKEFRLILNYELPLL